MNQDIERSVKVYRTLWERAEEQDLDLDTEGLDQTQIGAMSRYQGVCDVLNEHFQGSVLVDLGCGTGALLDFLALRSWLPKKYIGVDMFENRSDHVMSRGHTHRVDAEFVFKPPEMRFEDWGDGPRGDIGVMIGVIGLWDYSRYLDLKAVHRWMLQRYRHGAITVPTRYDAFLGHPDAAWFDFQDLQYFLQWQKVVEIHRHLVVYW